MALYAVPGETLTGIADAIRSKTGSDDFLTVAAMADAIGSISGGGDPNLVHRQYVIEQDTLNAEIDMPEVIGGAYLVMFYAEVDARQPTVGTSSTRCCRGGVIYGSNRAYQYGTSGNVGWTTSQSDINFYINVTTGKLMVRQYALLAGTYDIVVFKK